MCAFKIPSQNNSMTISGEFLYTIIKKLLNDVAAMVHWEPCRKYGFEPVEC